MPAQRDPSVRRRYRRAVLGGAPSPAATARPPLRVLTGTVVDASPHVLVLDTASGEARLPMTATTAVWHGGRGGPAALRPGRQAVVRMDADGLAADRVWLDIGRVTGTLLSARPDMLEIDLGPHRGRARVALDARALRLVQVRHPRLDTGYLVDVLCVRSPGGPRAVAPATSQPGHRADDLASPAPDASVPATTRGTVTWSGWPGAPQSTGMGDGTTFAAGPGGGPPDRAVAYPAVDGEGAAGGCGEAPPGCVPLPLLSLGSGLDVVNECTGRGAELVVAECGCVAARFCDRCVECGTSPRGRIAELGPAAFAALGGDLDAGCFNAAVRWGVGVGSW
ncbi:hypothetical protein DZF91_00565 [Actinomadura logoneensis]|uniref:Uncharacterized protein n=1 Tax=Actinomadura logoneensis TaxID=2293572 RepID=A0A372JUP9_9ACTN|nr:hypothetical protein [Actinomadura logoneensis]RFU43526.1 hypothetical protein DZF91_00565 [Actinomadura logoneensis]